MRGAILALLLAIAPPALAERVDVALVLLADASGSIDDAEIRFQRQGYATALTSPEVLAAIRGGLDGRIAVTYVEWAADASQDVVVPWRIVDGPETAAAFGTELLAAPRRAFGRNAIGSALEVARALLATSGFTAFRRVIDLSADSANSWQGVPLADARARVLEDGVVINGLAVLCLEVDCSGRPNRGNLEAQFAERIIGGPGSFVLTAQDRAGFVDAVRQKLVLEIAGLLPATGPGLAGLD